MAEPFNRVEAERRIHRAMVNGYDRPKREISYSATYFKRMVDADGGLAAAKHLLGGRPQDYAEGFTTLWMAGRLEMSAEFFALLPEYAPLFEEQELDIPRLEDVKRRLRASPARRRPRGSSIDV